MGGVWGQQQIPVPAWRGARSDKGRVRLIPKNGGVAQGGDFRPACQESVCVGTGRRKNTMGNGEIKITPVKTGCWKTGQSGAAGLAGQRVLGGSHMGAVRGRTPGSHVP